MDEPLWFGHSPAAHGGNPCHDPVGAVVANVAASVRRLQYSFPALRVGDTEPISDRVDPALYAHDFAAFADEFRAATGRPLAFFHADISWRQDWHSTLAMIRQVCQQRGIPFGVIFGGDPGAISDTDWVQQGIGRIEDIVSVAGVHALGPCGYPILAAGAPRILAGKEPSDDDVLPACGGNAIPLEHLGIKTKLRSPADCAANRANMRYLTGDPGSPCKGSR